MQKSLDLYLIATTHGHLLFIPHDMIERFEAFSEDRIRRALAWVAARRNRLAAWFGRALKTGHDYYLKLEDRIDPVERVLKTMAEAEDLVVYHGPATNSGQAETSLRHVLRKQRRKHVSWFFVDILVSSVVVALTPFLAPIPGPNVFFYYPVLRVLSHYRALRGCSMWLGSRRIQFNCLPGLSGLEENLRAPKRDRRTVRAAAERLNVRGLEQFLERMV
jgi:hypothetical protein